jgi:hypothetical protein
VPSPERDRQIYVKTIILHLIASLHKYSAIADDSLPCKHSLSHVESEGWLETLAHLASYIRSPIEDNPMDLRRAKEGCDGMGSAKGMTLRLREE